MEAHFSIEGVAYSFAGGFIGSAIFGGGADILGMRKSPSTEISLEAEKSVKKLQTELVRNGFSDMKKVSKLLSEAESLVKQASWFDNETKKFVLPENLATIFEAAKTVKYNPNTIEAVKAKETYKGVTAGKVDFEVKGDSTVSAGRKFSIGNIKGKLADYGVGVILDTDIFDGISPRNWTTVLKDFVYEKLAGKSVLTYDSQGNAEIIEFAKKNERVKKDGSDKSRKVLDKLARINGNIQKLSVVHLEEALNVPYSAEVNSEKSHNWLDENGWEIRTVYLQDKFGKIYEANLNIAKAKDGRKILYSVSNVKNIDASLGSLSETDGTAQNASMFNGSIPQPKPIVNAKSAISHRTAIALKALAKFTGVNVGFANNVTDADGRAVDGVYDSETRQITLSLNAQKPILFTAIHESMHHLRSYNPKLYALISGNILSIYKNNRDAFDVLFREVGERYASDIEGLSKNAQVDYLSEEVMSDLMAEVMCSSKGLSRLAGIDRNAFLRMYDAVINTYDFMTGRYKKLNVEHGKKMQDAIDVILEERKAFVDLYARGVEEYAEVWETNNLIVQRGIKLQRKDPTKLTESEFKELLELSKQKIFGNDTYIPARINTPHILISFANEIGYELDNHPLAMSVYKARQALANELDWDGNPRDKPHNLTVDDVVEIVKGMDNPSYLVYQTKNDRFAEIVKFSKDGGKEKAYAIIDFFDVEKNPDMMNGFEGGKYNILVTIYPSENSSELKQYLNDKKNIVMTGEEMKKKGASQGSYGSYVPSLLNDSPFFTDSIPDSDGKVKGKLSRQSAEGSYELSDVQLKIIGDITRRAAEKYGIRQLSQEEMKDVSLRQADIDARLGREFRFDDVTQPTVFKDINHNSLHLSDAVVFTSGEGANINFGTGRILGFDNSGNVLIAVDSGASAPQVTVPSYKVTFVAHNNEQTVSMDYTSANNYYKRAKTAFDNFGKTGDVRALDTFSYNEARNYLFDTSEKLLALSRIIPMHNDGYDRGTGILTGQEANGQYEAESEDFYYTSMSYRDLLLQFYDAVRNTNLARDISDLYIALGKETLDIEKMVINLKDVDRKMPFVKNNVIKNGSYVFNDVYRNFERVFGNYYDVVKPYLDNLDRSKGDYARNLIDKAEYLANLCSRFNFKPGDDFDKAVQMYGEGNVHINLRKAKDKKLFKKLGLDAANFNYGKEFDVSFNDVLLVKFIGEDRAGDVKECAKEFRALYDEYLVRVNETIGRIYPGQTERLIRPKENYFRHFKEVTDSLVSMMHQLAERTEIDPVLSGISQRTKPKKSFESYMQEREGECSKM